MPSLLSRNKILEIVVKNYTKTDLKVFCSCPIFLISLPCWKYVVRVCNRNKFCLLQI